MKKNSYWKIKILLTITVWSLFLNGCVLESGKFNKKQESEVAVQASSVEEVPEYRGIPYVEINKNEPEFTEVIPGDEAYEQYSELDSLGRCGQASARIGEELMPQEKRESISEVKPTGWKNKKYSNIDGEYVYNRCHLIGFQLTAENANEKNLITGTRYMNTEGMLPFENLVAEYIRETGNHVQYEITPIYDGDNLVASGVQMEARSVEDQGEEISFNVYVYNVQPGVEIDYQTGDNWETEEQMQDASNTMQYILNTNSKKFHKTSCPSVKTIKSKNRKEYQGKKQVLLDKGYDPCKTCSP